jgi:Outer membrane protein beta-barrel domain
MLKWAGIFVLLFVPVAMRAQAPESTVGGNSTFWAGGEISSFNPDFSCSSSKPFGCPNQLVGPTALFDLDVAPKWGVEGEARWLHWNGPDKQIESNYLGGGRYRAIRYGRLDAWVKMLFGAGLITTPNYPEPGSLKGSYFAYVPGGTLQYRLTHRISLRGDYEYEIWPSFAGPPSYSSSGALIQHQDGLTPNGFSLGVSYRFLGQ